MANTNEQQTILNEQTENQRKGKKRVLAKHIIPAKDSHDESSAVKNHTLYYFDGIMEHVDCVFMAPLDYKAMHGKYRSNDRVSRRRLAVVKVTYIDGKGRKHSIWRRFESCSALKESEEVALNYSSLNELLPGRVKDHLGEEVYLSNGSRFMYFWNHPFHATRISARLGWVSLALAIVSIVLSVAIPLIIQ